MIDEVKILTNRLRLISSTINDIGSYYTGRKNEVLGIRVLLYLDLYQRINANIETAILILDDIVHNSTYNKKISLSLITRNCLSDCLIGQYLLSVGDAFEAELNVIDCDYVKYLKDISPDEVHFINTLHNGNLTLQTLLDSKYEVFQKFLVSRKGEPWVLKGNDALRGNKNKESVTPKYAAKKLKEGGSQELKYLSYMYNQYRYLSQYEHYSFTGRHISRQPFDSDFDRLNVSFNMIAISVVNMTYPLGVDAYELVKPLKAILQLPPEYKSL